MSCGRASGGALDNVWMRVCELLVNAWMCVGKPRELSIVRHNAFEWTECVSEGVQAFV